MDVACDFHRRRTPYVFGGKSQDALDCSGLINRCYEGRLPDGASRQYEAVGAWLFRGRDLAVAAPGDLIFLANWDDHEDINHVGIVTARTVDGAIMVHASSATGEVVQEALNFNVGAAVLRGHQVVAVASMRPFLVRAALLTLLSDEVGRHR